MEYKQHSNQGCLVVDLMYLFGEMPTAHNEKQILSEGLFAFRDNYTIGCLLAFLAVYPDKRARIHVDNTYYLTVLKDKVVHDRIDMVLGKNDQKLLDSLSVPFIVYVDNYITDGFTHLPHFMMVVKSTEKMYDVFDPWEGKIIKISKAKLVDGIDLLRSHVKICPFIITAVL